MATKVIQTCSRCGHIAGAQCPFCGHTDPLLGAQINSDLLCHTFSVDYPTCYMLTSWQQTAIPFVGSDRVVEVEPPMTPEEEEMHE